MTHNEHSRKTLGENPPIKCSAWHLTFGGRCLNCGYDPLVHGAGSERCPHCSKTLSKAESDEWKCWDCGHYLVRDDGKLRMPKYKDE